MNETNNTVRISLSFLDESEQDSREEQVIFCVLSEMGLSFLGILLNLLVVTTIRHHEEGFNIMFLAINITPVLSLFKC